MDDSIAVNKPTASGGRALALSRLSAVRFYTPVAFALSLLILVLRYPTSLFAAEPLWEDGPIFYLMGFDGLSSLGHSYQGYLHLGARMVAIVAAAIPPALGPLLMNAVTILVTAGVATFIASDRLRSACPDRRLRLALAIGFVLMPAAQDLSWHLLVPALESGLLPVDPGARRRARPRRVWPDRAAVAMVALTGPFSILFAPLYLWRAPPPRRHGLDRRRVRGRPALRRDHRLSRAGRSDDTARGGGRARDAALRRAACSAIA